MDTQVVSPKDSQAFGQEHTRAESTISQQSNQLCSEKCWIRYEQ